MVALLIGFGTFTNVLAHPVDAQQACTSIKTQIDDHVEAEAWEEVVSLSQQARTCYEAGTDHYNWTYAREAHANLKAKRYRDVATVADAMMRDPAARDSIWISKTFAYAGQAAFWRGSPGLGLGAYRTAIYHEGPGSLRDRARLRRQFAISLLQVGHYGEARKWAEKSIRLAKKADIDAELASAIYFTASAVDLRTSHENRVSDPARGRQRLNRSIDYAEQISDPREKMRRFVLIDIQRASYAHLDDQYESAWTYARRAMREATTLNYEWGVVGSHVAGAKTALHFGELERAADLLEAARSHATGPDKSLVTEVLRLQVELAARSGDADRAYALVERLSEIDAPNATHQLYRAGHAIAKYGAVGGGSGNSLSWPTVLLLASLTFAAGHTASRWRSLRADGPSGDTEDASRPARDESRDDPGAREDDVRDDDVRDEATAAPGSRLPRSGPPVREEPPAVVARSMALDPPVHDSIERPAPTDTAWAYVTAHTHRVRIAHVPRYDTSGALVGTVALTHDTLRHAVGDGLALLDDGHGHMRLLATRAPVGVDLIRTFAPDGRGIEPGRATFPVRGVVVASVQFDLVPSPEGQSASGDGHGRGPAPVIVLPGQRPQDADPEGRIDPRRALSPETPHLADVLGLTRPLGRGDWVDLPRLYYGNEHPGVVRIPWADLGPLLARSLAVVPGRAGHDLAVIGPQIHGEVLNELRTDGLSIAPVDGPVRGFVVKRSVPPATLRSSDDADDADDSPDA